MKGNGCLSYFTHISLCLLLFLHLFFRGVVLSPEERPCGRLQILGIAWRRSLNALPRAASAVPASFMTSCRRRPWLCLFSLGNALDYSHNMKDNAAFFAGGEARSSETIGTWCKFYGGRFISQFIIGKHFVGSRCAGLGRRGCRSHPLRYKTWVIDISLGKQIVVFNCFWQLV